VRYITLSFSMAAERRKVEVKVNRDGARAVGILSLRLLFVTLF